MSIRPQPEGSVEAVAERSLRSKTFILPDGRKRLCVSRAPVHVIEEGGAYEEIDTTWRFNSGTNRYEVTRAIYRAEAYPDQVRYDYTSRFEGTAEIQLTEINDLPISGLNIAPQIQGHRLVYVDVLPDLDLVFEALPGRLEIWKRLKGTRAPRIFRWRVAEDEKLGIRAVTAGFDNGDGSVGREAGLNTRRALEIVNSKSAIDRRSGRAVYTMREEWTGRVSISDKQTRVRSFSTDFAYPIWIDQDVVEAIVADGDDGTSSTGAGWQQNYVYIATGWFPGWRFQTVAVDQGESIALAELKVQGQSGTAGTMTIYADDVDDAPAFAVGSRPPSTSFTATSAAPTVAFNPGSGVANAFDVTAVVQEVVDRAGWASGNDIRFGATRVTGSGYFKDYPTAGFGSLEITFDGGSPPAGLGQGPFIKPLMFLGGFVMVAYKFMRSLA